MGAKTDSIYEAYMGDMNQEFTRKVRERIHWICTHAQGVTVLDVGCSQGITSILLAREGMLVTGLDVEKQCIDFANEKLQMENDNVRKSLSFKLESFLSFEAPEHSFDTVIMTEVLEHILNVEDFLKKAQELTALDGRIIITVPFGINDFYDHKRTYYFADLYALLKEYFLVEQVEFFGKWIGYICKNSGVRKEKESFVALRTVQREEKAFYDIERKLSEKNKTLFIEISNYKQQKSVLSVKMDTLTGQIKDIREKNKKLAMVNDSRKIRIDELETQIQLIYKEQLKDFANLTNHLKNMIQIKSAETKKLKKKYDNNKKELSKAKMWKQKYKALSKSKLGRFTLNYWKYRDKVKNMIKGAWK